LAQNLLLEFGLLRHGSSQDLIVPHWEQVE
jgi:hypothetical protein